MAKAALKFNFKPKNGIAYLEAQNLICKKETDLEQHVRDIVKFLKSTPTLDKTKIGEFMGSFTDLNTACLYEFID